MGTMNDLPISKTATVVAVGGEGSLRQHFLDMGIIPQADVAMVKHAPMGDPVEVRIHGYELTLRRDDARKIEVADEREADAERLGGARPRRSFAERVEHPGLGEGGKFHDRDAERPLPEGEPLTFALVGNQNCGKTTLFNQLTGANQHVGNFPGVTVDRKDGRVRGHAEATVTDLPGIYSLSPYSSEEVVTRQFLLDERPRGIINIVDATNVERNLYLTMQLLELGVPMVVALNMMDEVEGNGGTIRVNEMEKLLGVPVVPISASKNEGIGELVDHALHVARYQEPPVCQDFCAADAHGGAVHRCLHGIMALVGDHAERAGIPVRFAASKLAEGDALVLEKLALDENEKHLLGHIVRQLEDERGLDRAAAIADMRFAFIERVCDECVVRPRVSREHARSMALDKLLTGTFTAIPAFVAIMALVFWLTFNVVGAWMSEMLEAGIGWLTDVVANALAAAQVNEVLQSLVIDGVFNGVGSVVGFLPTIVTLFFFLSLLEDSGYMARVAFVMDKLLRKIGLSGRSIVPMLVGFGCTVPAVMVGLYVGGMAVGVLAALLMRKSLFSGEAVPFVMELPNYRMPSARNVGQLLWEKAKDFLERAFTIIFIATIVIWFLQTFDFGLNVVADSADSMLAVVAGWIAPVFAPLGFDDWRISTALVTGVMAKESVVSTLSVLFGSTASLVAALTPLAALGLLVFCLLYTPCVAAIASVRRELGGRWALAMVFGQFAVAWLAALAVRGAGLAMELPAGEAWSVAVGAAVAVAVALVLRRMARRRRAGAGGCGGGCAGGCAGCSATTCAGCAQEGESRPKPPDAETLAESRR